MPTGALYLQVEGRGNRGDLAIKNRRMLAAVWPTQRLRLTEKGLGCTMSSLLNLRSNRIAHLAFGISVEIEMNIQDFAVGDYPAIVSIDSSLGIAWPERPRTPEAWAPQLESVGRRL
jgi:hypothetical protein